MVKNKRRSRNELKEFTLILGKKKTGLQSIWK